MLVVVEEARSDDRGVRYHRQIASWSLPDTTEPIEMSFTQLATPNTTKVVTYRLTVASDILHDPKLLREIASIALRSEDYVSQFLLTESARALATVIAGK